MGVDCQLDYLYLSQLILFTHIQDEILRQAVDHFKGKNWKKIGIVGVLAYCRGQGYVLLY